MLYEIKNKNGKTVLQTSNIGSRDYYLWYANKLSFAVFEDGKEITEEAPAEMPKLFFGNY